MGLLLCVGRAVAKHGARFLCGFAPGGGVLYEIALDAYQDYRVERDGAALREEVLALASRPSEQLRADVQEVVRAVAADRPPEERAALADYLGQIPAGIRRSLRRPSDPSGITAPPGMSLDRAEALAAMLPARPPRFRSGQRPLPGLAWELSELLGVGGFGEVWLARHATLRSRRPVALKFCLDPAAAKSLRNEAGVLDRLQQRGHHDGIVRLEEVYLEGDPPCLQYEYVEGGDLGGLLREWHAAHPPSAEVVARHLLQIVEAVAFAHAAAPPIVHCDLKPANILVETRGGGAVRFRITDFGIGGLASRCGSGGGDTAASQRGLITNAVRGAYTPLYASPEQRRRGAGDAADPRDDVHALGVIWYQMVTGDLTSEALPSDWRDILADRGTPEPHVALLARCVASRPEKRIASAVALAGELARLGGGPSVGRVTKPGEPGSATQVRLAAPRKGRAAGEVLKNEMGMEFAWCPPGKYLMGSPPGEIGRGEDEPQRRVTIGQGFWIGLTPVTQPQWEKVAEGNPSRDKGPSRPVESVSWDDCVAFCRLLGKLDGWSYRLPTAEEWEYACRAGTTTPYSFGVTLAPELARYHPDGTRQSRELMTTADVRSYPPNGWGLFGMHGNVFEWCQTHREVAPPPADFAAAYSDLANRRRFKECYDLTVENAARCFWAKVLRNAIRVMQYGADEQPEDEANRRSPAYASARMTRLLRWLPHGARGRRGGSWSESAAECRSAYTDWSLPCLRMPDTGCRVVLSSE